MTKIVKILFVADVVGLPGRLACEYLVPRILRKESVDFTVINAENVAGVAGITSTDADLLLHSGADVLTSGNHIWRRQRIKSYLKNNNRLLRPANYHHSLPGSGCEVFRTQKGIPIGVINIQGRVFMENIEHPFDTADICIESIRDRAKVILVDFHAEATSEKVAMGVYLSGRASVVVGTHTHVQTADERILDGGTAFICDAGMTGPYESIIGVKPKLSLDRFLKGTYTRFEAAEGLCALEGILATVDVSTGKAKTIQRLRKFFDPDKGREVKP